MKTIFKYIITAVVIGLMIAPMNNAFAGNKDRTGEAGGNHLLINPWARSAGWGGVGTGNVKGVESLFVNVAGIAHTQGTEVAFTNTDWLSGSGTNIMAFGLNQSVGDGGVLALNVMSMGFGDINITTEDHPANDGGLGTFSPNVMYIGAAFSKAFSNSIYGGVQVKIVTEGLSDVTASGVAIDAGIQYISGENDEMKFGVTLRNWGPTMKFSGEGLAFQTMLEGQDNAFTVATRSVEFELPSQLNIGASYDILMGEASRFTVAGQFSSNAFTNDQYTLGGEFSLKEYVELRAAYTYEDGMFGDLGVEDINAHSGFSGGLTVQAPLNKETGSFFSVDYSYRQTQAFNGIHSIGVRLAF
jgi:hypothetical protein